MTPLRHNEQLAASTARYQVSPDAVYTRMDDRVVLIHLKTDRIFELNGTAARLWELLIDGCDRMGITRCMREEYDVTEADLVAEIERLVTSLRAERLIQPRGASERVE